MKRIHDPLQLRKILSTHDIYRFFDADITPYVTMMTYEPGESVLTAGDALTHYLLLVDGRIKVSYLFENGKTMAVKFYHPLTPIGDIEYLRDVPLLCNVDAIETSSFIAIDVQTLRTHFSNDVAFLKHLIESLSDKLYATVNNNAYNFIYPLPNRLASYLLHQPSTNNVIVLHASYLEIADFLGTTYRHLNRTIRMLVDEGIIEQRDHEIEITNRTHLEMLAKSTYIGTT
ncbi:helix-turn-helix domain-containing protein [Fusibacter paucivorans]|uniref:Helix-turn-helix domain-containing protein n=1 Tax=Fusibacter paucivorans TaxID=76009 RepID=A0ABS5PL64_9FIRM|nr:helix-turn-helix domain-containing protein [Fusibacter paucivorans]MBS7525124.1 helix-turn-helix domain-containing protein [Fusibacter paucivorans]